MEASATTYQDSDEFVLLPQQLAWKKFVSPASC